MLATACDAEPDAGSIAAQRVPAGQEARSEPGQPATPRNPGLFDQETVIAKVEKFVAGVDLAIVHPEIEGQFSLDEMIVHGLEQEPPRHIVTQEGELIVWGWSATRQEDKSLLIFGANGELGLVAFSHALPSLRSMRGKISHEAIEGHAADLNDDAAYVTPPFMNIYIDEQTSPDRLYALSRLWVEATVLGFNADCSDPDQQALCSVAQRFEPSIRIYSLQCLRESGDHGDCLIPVPTRITTAGLSVEAFVQ